MGREGMDVAEMCDGGTTAKVVAAGAGGEGFS